MNRPIKFRAQRLGSKEWVYGDLIKHSKIDPFTYIAIGTGYKINDPELGAAIKVLPHTLGQLTGLLDKNGVEIYEGDILEFSNKWEWYRSVYGVKMMFAEGEARVALQEKYDAEPMYRREVKYDLHEGYGLSKDDLQNYLVVIGNIYENSDLLV